MMSPRRGDAAADLDLVPGLLGAVAVARRIHGVIAGLVADGDGAAAAEPASDDVVDAVLGLAALAARIHELAASAPAPAATEPTASAATTPLTDLLR